MGCSLLMGMLSQPPVTKSEYVPVEGAYGKQSQSDNPISWSFAKPVLDGTFATVYCGAHYVNVEVTTGFSRDMNVEYRKKCGRGVAQTFTTSRKDVKLPVCTISNRTDAYPNSEIGYSFLKGFYSDVYSSQALTPDGQESLTLPGSGVSVMCTKFKVRGDGQTIPSYTLHVAADGSLPVPVQVTSSQYADKLIKVMILDSQEVDMVEIPEYDLEEIKSVMRMAERDKKRSPWEKPEYKAIGTRSIRTYKYVANMTGFGGFGGFEVVSPDVGVVKEEKIVGVRGFSGKIASFGGNRYTVQTKQLLGIAGDAKFDAWSVSNTNGNGNGNGMPSHSQV
jgi:hypothetical protein